LGGSFTLECIAAGEPTPSVRILAPNVYSNGNIQNFMVNF